MKKIMIALLGMFAATAAFADSAAALTAIGELSTDAVALATGALPLVSAVVIASVGVSFIPKVAKWIKGALGR